MAARRTGKPGSKRAAGTTGKGRGGKPVRKGSGKAKSAVGQNGKRAGSAGKRKAAPKNTARKRAPAKKKTAATKSRAAKRTRRRISTGKKAVANRSVRKRRTATKFPAAGTRKPANGRKPVPAARASVTRSSTAPRPAPRRPAIERTSEGIRVARARRTVAKPLRDPRQTAPRKIVSARRPGAARSHADAGGAALLERLDDLIKQAKRAGADAADAVTFVSASLTQAVRLGEPETLERSESRDLGLRVFLGRRQAIVSSSDFSADAMAELVERALAMVRAVPEDRFCGLAEPGATARRVPDLDMFDPVEPTPDAMLERARACEEAARAVPGITNSIGAESSWGMSRVALVASNGFAGSFASSNHAISVSVVAGEGTAMERDHDMSVAVFAADLEAAEEVGRRAAGRTIRRLNPKKIASATMPVVFDRRVAGGLIGHVAGAANGSAIARGTSFLKDAMGTMILPAALSLIDDPLRRRGLASIPFDGEGIATRRLAIVENGRLASWVLDLATARQLGMATTGHARRGTSSPPSPATSNLHLDGGTGTVDALIADIGRGLYVTDLMGFGVNMVTGDYSRGAAGFLIENGRLGDPVSEVTIAGNLKDMLPRMRAAGDLEFRYGTNAPTVRIDGMAIGGS